MAVMVVAMVAVSSVSLVISRQTATPVANPGSHVVATIVDAPVWKRYRRPESGTTIITPAAEAIRVPTVGLPVGELWRSSGAGFPFGQTRRDTFPARRFIAQALKVSPRRSGSLSTAGTERAGTAGGSLTEAGSGIT